MSIAFFNEGCATSAPCELYAAGNPSGVLVEVAPAIIGVEGI
jgi:hypothetical protein